MHYFIICWTIPFEASTLYMSGTKICLGQHFPLNSPMFRGRLLR